MRKSLLIILCSIAISASAQNSNEKLILDLPFNGNAIDQSGTNAEGVVTNAVLSDDRFGKAESAYYFDGDGDYIEIANFGDTLSSNEITVSMWLKSYLSKGQFQMMLLPDNNRFAVSANFNHGGVNHTFWDCGWTGGGGNAPGRLYNQPEPFDTLWHHYVFVSSISELKMEIYRDDTLVISENDPLPVLNKDGRRLRIGSGDNAFYFKGYIDDIKIFNEALGEDAIEDLFYNNFCIETITQIYYDTVTTFVNDTVTVTIYDTVTTEINKAVFDTVFVYDTITTTLFETISGKGDIPNDPVLYLPFDGDASDLGSNKMDGVVNSATLAADRFGKVNSAYEFDGTDDYISIPNFGNITPDEEITVSMWLKSYKSKAQFQMMLCPDNNRFAVSVNYNHGSENHNFWDFGWTGAGGNAPGRLYNRPEPFDTAWHHYVFTSSISNSLMEIYKDGKLIISESDPLTLINADGKELKIGSGDNNSYFMGLIDDVIIYDRALTVQEISSLSLGGGCTKTIYDTVKVEGQLVIDIDVSTVTSTPAMESILIYPSLVKDVLHIDCGLNTLQMDYDIMIVDLVGKVIFQSKLEQPNYTINIDEFGNTGMYIVNIMNNTGSIVKSSKIILE